MSHIKSVCICKYLNECFLFYYLMLMSIKISYKSEFNNIAIKLKIEENLQDISESVGEPVSALKYISPSASARVIFQEF